MRLSDFPFIQEINAEYLRLRRCGNSRAQTTSILVERYAAELEHCDDASLFWIGLADAMYNNKELTVDTAQHGIDSLNALSALDWKISANDIHRRRSHYSEAPMPERPVRKARPPFRCAWAIGDTFAFPLSDSEANAPDGLGRYALIRKVSDVQIWDNRILPVVTISIWDDLPFPTSSLAFAKAPILKLATGKKGMLPGQYEYRAVFMIKNQKQLERMNLHWVPNSLQRTARFG